MLICAGLQKTFTLPCLEAEILQATVDRDSLPTHVIAAAKELNRSDASGFNNGGEFLLYPGAGTHICEHACEENFLAQMMQSLFDRMPAYNTNDK